MIDDPTWFRKQLDIVTEETDKWPDWARREAGLPTFEPSDKEMLDWLDSSHMGTYRGFFVRTDGAIGNPSHSRGSSIREAIRAAMKAESGTQMKPLTAFHCSTCGVELTPYIRTPCSKSENGLHRINDDDFKAVATARLNAMKAESEQAAAGKGEEGS